MPQTRTRVVGSGFSSLSFNGRPLAFLDGFNDSGQTALGAGAMGAGGGGTGWEPVIPLDARYAIEWATSRVLNPGQLTITLRELWNEPAWWRLGFGGTVDIVQVFERLAQTGEVTAQMIIRPPNGGVRTRTYHNLLITNIDDTETVTVGALTIGKNIQAVYSHKT